MRKTNKTQHDQKTLFWTILGSVAGVAGAVIGYFAFVGSHQPPTINNNFSPSNVVNVHSVNNNSADPSQPQPVVIPTNLPVLATARKLPVLTDAEKQMLEQAQQDLDLAPFMITGNPAKKPSYSVIQPMLATNNAGLDKIYQFLCRTTNSATGEPWIEAAPTPGFMVGSSDGKPVPNWYFHEPTKQLLNARQQVLLKFVPVLVKAGELSP